MSVSFPTISIVVPTFNEEKNIKICLDSIFKQDYPKKLLEVFVVDNYSIDKTLQIAKKYPVHILFNKVKDAQVSKMIAFRKAKGDLFYFTDADLEFKSNDYLSRLVRPLLDDASIVGSFGRPVPSPHDSSLNRFLSYDNLQRDPVFEFFSPSIESTIVEKRKEYFLCKYKLGRITSTGRCLYWRKILMRTQISKKEKFMELDNLVILVKNGFTNFAYVPEAEEYHRHMQGIKTIIRKRLRNINRNYIPNFETREYRWFDLTRKRDVIKIIFWIFYAHSILPAFLKGCYKAIKYRDILCIWYEPFLTLLLTDVILFGFLSTMRSRRMIVQNILAK